MKLDATALESLIGKDAARILREANLCVIPRRCLNPLLLQSGVPARELKAKRQFLQDSPLLGLLAAKRQAQQPAPTLKDREALRSMLFTVTHRMRLETNHDPFGQGQGAGARQPQEKGHPGDV